MDHGVAAVDQHPFAHVFAFHGDDVAAGFLDGVTDGRGEGLGLAVGRTAGDDRAVEQFGQVRRIEDLDVLRLDVFERVDDHAL